LRVQKIVNASPSRNVLISPLEDPLNVISTFNEAVTVTEICDYKQPIEKSKLSNIGMWVFVF
jgi:hypothetical protein